MKKELEEALEGLFPCSHKVCEGICAECQQERNYELIKSALERKEKLEKAWEIIKNSAVIEIAETYAILEDIICIPCNDIYTNKEKYNLLKEMLEEIK